MSNSPIKKGSLESAIEQATQLHAGQMGKDGLPFILHPLTVLTYVTENGYGVLEQIVAILHDVCEDCDVVPEEFRFEFGSDVASALDAITRREGETYNGYIRRVSFNLIATRVKIVDLEHNMDLGRLPEITEKDIQRQGKYAKSHAFLQSTLDSRD